MGPKTTLRNIIMELKKRGNHPLQQFEKVEDITVETTVETFNRISGAESPMAKRLKRNTRGSKNSDALHGELSRKEERMLVRIWERFSDPFRARDTHRCVGGSGRLEEQKASNLLIEALSKSRDVVREAERYPVNFLDVA
jgi:hypothetical protein